MKILGIETSCDETAAAVVTNDQGRITILSKVISSSASLQSKYGGVIPDSTAREQLKVIIPTIQETLEQAGIKPEELDAIAVTVGPGLIGSLLVGVETAKTLALAWNKPLIPVNHLIAHFYANWVSPEEGVAGAGVPTRDHAGSEQDERPRTSDGGKARQDPTPKFPLIGLLISGGHTDLVLMKDHGQYEYLGGTRDDAAGECFDKSARLLNLPYPGGPNLSRLAEAGDPKRYSLPRPMLSTADFDFSFSGLKTAFGLLVEKELKLEKGHFDKENRVWMQKTLEDTLGPNQLQTVSDLCASLEESISEVLMTKTIRAAKLNNIDQIILAGGVAANTRITKAFLDNWKEASLSIPPPNLCTDNAVMVATVALFLNQTIDPLLVEANPNLDL